LCALFGYQRQGRTKEEEEEEEEDREGEDPTRFRILLQSKEADDPFLHAREKKQIKSISLLLLSIERQNLWIS
jgi:pullulanase/glycogen debranching enzyme|tara:strand:- start:3245 stop:3463 length:219 start_codon:yes stop_codon:yes gene_type:complete